MVNEIADTIRRVVPRAVRILVFQDKIQISLRDFPVLIVRELLRGAGQQKCPISRGINDALRVERRVRAAARGRRRWKVFDIVGNVSRD